MRGLVLFLSALAAFGQTVTNPDKLPARWKTFERPSASEKLNCRVSPIRPRLNLGFRFQTGYTVEVPMKQYSGAGHWWSAVVRVTPETEEREPVWLVTRMRIPPVPETKVTAEFSGAYLVGEGKYRVDMLLVDDSNRICTAGWNIRAKLSDEIREVRPGMPPGAVDDISLRRWPRLTAAAASASSGGVEPQGNVSILLHAAATTPNRVRLRGYDRTVLLSALVSLLERLPVANVQLTIFTMDGQKEIYHTDELSTKTFSEAVEALNALELGIVDYSTLQNRGGHIDLVSDLLNRELESKDAPDAVIFLGPVARSSDRLSNDALPVREGLPPVYYVQLRPWRLMASVHNDTISRTVRKLGGRTKEVYSPEDFAEAIQDLDRLLNRRSP